MSSITFKTLLLIQKSSAAVPEAKVLQFISSFLQTQGLDYISEDF